MAKGAQAKEEVFNRLLEVFEGSFMADAKTLRIPMVENGDTVEIKVTLTAAKDIIGGGNPSSGSVTPAAINFTDEPIVSTEPTQEEKDNVAKLVERLGLNF